MSSYREKSTFQGGCDERDSQWGVMPGGVRQFIVEVSWMIIFFATRLPAWISIFLFWKERNGSFVEIRTPQSA